MRTVASATADATELIGSGASARLVELPAGQTTWRDTSPGRGGLYLYTVTAFDQSGNESPPSKPAEGHLP